MEPKNKGWMMIFFVVDLCCISLKYAIKSPRIEMVRKVGAVMLTLRILASSNACASKDG